MMKLNDEKYSLYPSHSAYATEKTFQLRRTCTKIVFGPKKLVNVLNKVRLKPFGVVKVRLRFTSILFCVCVLRRY